MNRKQINVNGYTIGHRVSSWHNFMDVMAKCVIIVGMILGVLVIVAIVTLPVWAH